MSLGKHISGTIDDIYFPSDDTALTKKQAVRVNVSRSNK
jgi:hypothetical protein